MSTGARLRVYAWTAARGGKWSREAIAAVSIAEARRLVNAARPGFGYFPADDRNAPYATNAEEIAVATETPGVLCWKIDGRPWERMT